MSHQLHSGPSNYRDHRQLLLFTEVYREDVLFIWIFSELYRDYHDLPRFTENMSNYRACMCMCVYASLCLCTCVCVSVHMCVSMCIACPCVCAWYVCARMYERVCRACLSIYKGWHYSSRIPTNKIIFIHRRRLPTNKNNFIHRDSSWRIKIILFVGIPEFYSTN